MNKYFLFLILLLIISCDSDSDNPVTPTEEPCETEMAKGDRTIGIDLLDNNEILNFDNNLALASELGVEFIALHLPWTSIETAPNVYEDPGSALELLGQVAQSNNLLFSLTIRPIDIPGKFVPSDLESTRFNDSEMINRFKSLIDFILTKVDVNVLLNFQIGNEIDGYNTSTEPASFWADYGIFLSEMTAYLHTIRPSLKVGFTGTLHGLIAQTTTFDQLLTNVDILGANYYPLNGDFTVKDPVAVFDDIEDLINSYPNASIYMQEVGYQTSVTCNSSEAKQGEFFDNLFCVWDTYSSEIKSMNIVRLNDLSQSSAESSALPYGISDERFIEYLRTLGIRTYPSSGTNKTAFTTIKENLSERGW